MDSLEVVRAATDGEAASADTVASPASTAEVPRVSVIIVSYNGRRFLGQCLTSLFRQAYPEYEVLLVDNGSSDGSAEFVEHKFPKVRVIRNRANVGFGRANNVGASQATGEYLAFLNQDTVVHPDWLARLLAVLESHPTAAMATPKILLLDQPARINTCGNQTHYTGLTFCRGVGEPADSFDQVEVVDAVSGAAFVMKKGVLEEIGGFDEHFFLYMEDVDLSWRARLAGYMCLYVPNSVVYHEYALVFGRDKSYYQERNRWLMLLKNLRLRTLLLLWPGLLVAELITWGWMLLWDRPNIANKPLAYWWLLRNWRQVLQARRTVQQRRSVPDKDLISQCGHRLAYEQLAGRISSRLAHVVFDPVLWLVQSVCAALMRW